MVSWTRATLRIPKALPKLNWAAVEPKSAELKELTWRVEQIAKVAFQDRKSRLQFAYELPTETSSDADSDGYSSSDDEPLEEIVEDLNAYMENLLDLSPSLDHPAIDFVFIEDPTTNLNDILSGVTEPARPFVLAIWDRFPSMEPGLVRRLGEANWNRRQRLREKLSAALEQRANLGTSHDGLDIEDTDDTVVGDSERHIARYEASTVASSFSHPSTYQSSTVRSGFSGPSIFDRDSILVPDDRRRSIAQSMTSFASSIMDGSEPGQRRVPNLPDNYDFESPFECPICGDILADLRHRADWRKHVFNDLEPYICLLNGCTLGICTFKSRTEWMQHEFQTHRVGIEWRCTFCTMTSDSQETFRAHLGLDHTGEIASSQIEELISASKRVVPCDASKEICPFCVSTPAQTREGFARHVGKHQQDTSLAALPNLDTSSDGDSDSSDSGNDNDSNGDGSWGRDSPSDRSDGEDDSGSRVLNAKDNDNDDTGSVQSEHLLYTLNQKYEEGSTSEEEGSTSEGSEKQAPREYLTAIIKELLDSERVFSKDMKVVVHIYKAPTMAWWEVEPGDVALIFRNIEKILDFSTLFLKELLYVNHQFSIWPIY